MSAGARKLARPMRLRPMRSLGVWLLASLLATCIPSRNFMGGARTWQLRACRRVHLLHRLHIRSLLAVFLLNCVFFPHGRRPYWCESLAFFPLNLAWSSPRSMSPRRHLPLPPLLFLLRRYRLVRGLPLQRFHGGRRASLEIEAQAAVRLSLSLNDHAVPACFFP